MSLHPSPTPVELPEASPAHRPPLAAVVALLTVVIGALLIAFGWPAVRTSLHDVPLAVAGPSAATGRVAAELEQRRPGAFTVVAVPDTAAAEALIRDREVYGAIDLSAGAPQVITASAASPLVAQALQALAAGLGQASPVPVRDLVPLPPDDPRGAGLAAGSLPLVLGGLLGAVLLTRLVRGTGRRVAGALAFAVVGGLALVAILQFWFGSLAGGYWVNSAAVALAVAATALTLLGLEALLGAAGLGIGAVLILLVGNPLAGTASAPEMLPGWSGELGRYLPPGASTSLLRSTAFFDGGGALAPLLVLLGWLLLGLVLCLAGRARRPS
ncbi:membrane protein [Pseudonocardia ailaonensis]|uniref:Membrane protein n=1 Tax=Pseudonocardia ailaonensis TaxID=367279 RepID=A0ABN2NRZ7_9PSEU